MAANPRKQTVVILVVCILMVGGVAFYVYGRSAGFSKAGTSGINSATDFLVSPQETLPVTSDWQKQFLGANATTTTFKNTAKTTAPQQEERLTATDLLGRAFLTKYGELQQSGLSNDSKSVESVMRQVTAESLAGLPSPKTFSASDIRLSASSTSALGIYSKSVLLAFRLYMPETNEMEIANQAFADNDMAQLKNIDPVIANYKKMITELVAVPIPMPLVQYHINLLDGIAMALYNAESFRHSDTDPVRGLAAVSLELVALQNIATAIASINDYLIATGVQAGS